MFALASILSLVALIISVPIFLVFGLGSSVAAIGGLNLPWSVLIQVSFGALTKHVLIAVPLFIFSGMAIMTFVENLAGINITDPILNAKANAIMQSAQELFMPLNPIVNFAKGEKFKKKREDIMPFLMSRFEDLEKVIKENDKKFFILDEPRACDFVTFHHLDLSKMLDPSIIKKFPRLEKFLEDIMSIDSVKSYLENRPELIDVSVEPKLVIDGIPHPTGVKKT